MLSPTDVHCAVAARRATAQITLTALAGRIGISRQALTAIEAGRATPSTAVALRLARELGCTVEDLFTLGGAVGALSLPDLAGSRVALGRVSGAWVAHRLDATRTAPADALVDAQGAVHPLDPAANLEQQVLLAGCAPVLDLLAGRAGRAPGTTWLHAGSGVALDWLANGRVHVAGMHLAERDHPEHHDSLIRDTLRGSFEIITLLTWREGLITAPENPHGIASVADLQQPGLRIVRRTAGSGAAKVLERALAAAGLADLPLAGPQVATHGDAALAIALGAADAAVAIEPVAEAAGLPFIPLSEERFELVLRTEDLDHPGVVHLLSCLTAARFRSEVAGMGAYDVDLTGVSRRITA